MAEDKLWVLWHRIDSVCRQKPKCIWFYVVIFDPLGLEFGQHGRNGSVCILYIAI